MKTLIIFNYCGIIQYFIVDGDYSKYHNIVFNIIEITDLESECTDWLWDDDGNMKHKMSDDISLVENKQWNKVAIITWMP